MLSAHKNETRRKWEWDCYLTLLGSREFSNVCLSGDSDFLHLGSSATTDLLDRFFGTNWIVSRMRSITSNRGDRRPDGVTELARFSMECASWLWQRIPKLAVVRCVFSMEWIVRDCVSPLTSTMLTRCCALTDRQIELVRITDNNT